MLKLAPNPVEVQDFQFKLRCRLKVFDNTDNTNFPKHCSLVACASRFGLVFVGTNSSNLQAIQLKNIEEFVSSSKDNSDYPRRNLPLPSPPTHLSINCEHTILAVVFERNSCPCALFYDVKSFWQKDITQIGEVRLSATPSVGVTEVNWNPALGPVFTACKSDGTLGIYEIKNTGIDINELPAAAGATCFCWSPKGKQIAVGARDGKITQYKPDLKAVKVINAPPFKEPYSLQSLQWVSNYQFIGVYQPLNPDQQAAFIVIDAPKTGNPNYINYDDICYSNGNTRPVQFYTVLLHNWNVYMAASSNSMEVGILGSSGESWTQWSMGDAARAELPLSKNRQETLPIGCGLDIGSTQPLPWGESTIPPVPFLLLLSHHGTLCVFNVINLKEGIPTICTPHDPISDTSGLQLFVTGGSKAEKKEETPVKEVVVTKAPTTPSFFKTQPQTQGVSLFGGQATLTPVSKETKSTPTSAALSYQALYPTNPTSSEAAVQLVVSSSSVTPPTPQVTPVKPVEKTEDSINLNLKAEEEAEEIFAQMVKEECVFLESEVNAVLHQGRLLKFNLGTDEDKTKLVTSTLSLEEFLNELVDICTTQNSEVHILKQNLLQSWAWYEEVKSRHLASQDESLLVLTRAQPLDSASEKQLADIRHANYYLESQITQAHAALDEQWDSFQDYCRKRHKIEIPTMEMIFQTMVKQNTILRKQSYVLKDIASKIRNKSRSSLGPSLLVSLDESKNLPEELKRLRMNPEDISQIHYEHVMNRNKNFTQEKVENLRSFLKKRQYPCLSIVKPQLSSSIIQSSPSMKLKFSKLSEKTSKEPIPRVLDFAQSTPKPTSVKFETATTPIEGLQNFALTFDAKNFTNLSEKTFAPLTKNVIAGSPNSAFVSTSLGSNVITTSAPVTYKPAFMGTASVVKSTPSTTQVITVPKPFVTLTISSQPSVLNTPKSLFGTSTSNTTFSFNLQTTTAATNKSALIFDTKPATSSTKFTTAAAVTTTSTSIFGKVASTPAVASSTSIFGKGSSSLFTTSAAAVTNFGNASTTAFSFGLGTTTPSTSAQFSFGSGSSGTSNLFGATTPKVTEATKSFIFSTKTTVPQSTPSTNVVSSSTQRPVLIVTSAATLPKTISVTTEVQTTTPTSILSTSSGVSTGASLTQPSPSLLGALKSSIFPSPSIPVALTSKAIPSSTGNVTSSPSTTSQTSIFASVTTMATPTSQLNIFGPTTTAATSTVVTTMSQSSIFGSVTSPTTTSQSNIFGSVTSTATSTAVTTMPQSSIFGSVTSRTTTTQSSLFGSVTTTATSTAVTTMPQSSIFASVTTIATTTSQPNLFGPITASTATTMPQSSIFGTASTQSSAVSSTSLSFGSIATSKPLQFGSTDATVSKPGLFSSVPPSTTSTVFGTDTNVSKPSLFGNIPAATSAPIFGTAASADTNVSKTSIFGSVPSSTSTASVFGAAATPTTQISIFGSTPTSSTAGFGASPSTTSAFGATTTNQSSLFGSSANQSVFGTPTSTTSASTTSQTQGFGLFGDSSQKPSLFGSATPNSTQSPIFGATTQSSIFGGTTTSTNSVFGQNQSVFDSTKNTSSTFGQSSVFGSSGGTFGNAFGGSTPAFGQTPGSLFGNAPTTSAGSPSVFGATTTSGNTFGASSSVFGTPVSSTSSVFGSPTQSNTFGANTNSGAFGFGNLNVGAPATTASSGFGTPPNPFGGANKSVFGGSAVSSSGSIFGSNTGSVFGNTSQTFGGGFGSQSTFSQQSTFGQSTFGSSTFGQQSAGPFSGGSGTVNQSGFGASPTFQKPSGFGASPVFGGSPSFGSAPSFGGAPAFGNTTAFGSTTKVFGSSSPGFGAVAPNTQNNAFGNLANQPTVGFGNLAQQAANSPTSGAPFSGNSSFSSWR